MLTPGPWEVTEAGVVSRSAKGANVVCEAPIHYLDSHQHWQDNGRAIAALPDLLDAANKARKALSHLLMTGDPIVYREALNALDAALGKAGQA